MGTVKFVRVELKKRSTHSEAPSQPFPVPEDTGATRDSLPQRGTSVTSIILAVITAGEESVRFDGGTFRE